MTAQVFQASVDALTWLADLLGVTYEQINVGLFCVLWPAATLLQTAVILWQYRALRRLVSQPHDQT